ncbi:diguanylate cyclase [Nodosilinea sp. LEGE 07088]|uniref:diguanylate cyclase n=1 Tax=Nodosilinea sp. LEGE 07088 TaxID=2777968 RepID=UPI0018821B1A|nr:diguanylate cyclase [Nodosilinea sp. LEGE 07088]MBE9138762.1 diguanylate cyclase [Nodosilinea sp. LEGE 07088]
MITPATQLKETILVVDDTPNNLELLLRALTAEGYEVRCARSGQMALTGVQASCPDLILLDIRMPYMDGYEVCQRLRQNAQTAAVPIIILSVLEDGPDKVRAFDLGANDYIAKPFSIEEVLARIKYQLTLKQQRQTFERITEQYQRRNQELQAAYTLLMDVMDSLVDGVGAFQTVRNRQGQITDFIPQVANSAFTRLINRGTTATTGQTMREQTAHFVDCDLFDLCVQVVDNNETIRQELLCRYGDTEHWVEIVATRLRDGIVTSLRDISDTKEHLATLESVKQEMYLLATTDSLTQVANRYRFDAYLQAEWQRLARERQPLSLLIGDIDKFKRFNDLCGHSVGDRCLRAVAQAIQSVVRRPADLVARYGGEEFGIVLPNTPMGGALQIAKTIQTAIRGLQLADTPRAECEQVRLSLGIACTLPQEDQRLQDLVEAADRALYRAKARGGNTNCAEMI